MNYSFEEGNLNESISHWSNRKDRETCIEKSSEDPSSDRFNSLS